MDTNRKRSSSVKSIGLIVISWLGLVLSPLSIFCDFFRPLIHLLHSSIIKYRLARPIPKIVWILPKVTLINPKRIRIGENARVGKYSTLSTWGKNDAVLLIIGDNSRVGEFAHITAINKVLIGRNVLIGKYVTITDNAHGKCVLSESGEPPISRELYSKGETVIKDNVWIGDKVSILPGVSIGRGAVIGANSVVTSDIPDYTVACGNPARVIKQMR